MRTLRHPCPPRALHEPILLPLPTLPAEAAAPASLNPADSNEFELSTPIAVRLLSFNDLHGNLQPPTGSSGRVVLDNGTTVDAGGVAYLAAHIKQERAEVKNSVLLSTGDAIGASPLESALFHDEPTIDALNAMRVKAMAVGNHEFDEGYTELLRIQRGGCHPTDGCQFDRRFRGAAFPILGANVTFAKNRRPALLPFTVVRSGGQSIGVIGITLKDVTDPAGKPRPVIQGLSFGRLLSVIDLKIDPRTRDVIRSATSPANNPVAHNEIVTRDVTPDRTVQAIVDKAVTASAPLANQQVGTITDDLTRDDDNGTGETALGDVIADAQLAATQGNDAQIAITNPGGIRADLTYASSTAGEGDGVVTYGEAFKVQPFSNIMQTITLTGAQLDAVLEQQWQPQADGTTIVRILQISDSLHYTMTPANTIGDRVSGLALNGAPVDPAATYRVSVNNFLAAGGDGFTVFTEGTDLTGGPIDLDAFTAYLSANSPISPPPLDRITLG